jgi:hypothetical protein
MFFPLVSLRSRELEVRHNYCIFMHLECGGYELTNYLKVLMLSGIRLKSLSKTIKMSVCMTRSPPELRRHTFVYSWTKLLR